MSTFDPICPQKCQDKHNSHEITMTKILGRLDNINDRFDSIEEKLDNALGELKNLAECKADKVELDKLKTAFYREKDKTMTTREKVMVWAITVLIGLFVYFFIYWMQHHTT